VVANILTPLYASPLSSRSGYQGDITTYQISATVQSSNSGGPLFNEDGDVIGIINARLYVESATYAIKKYIFNCIV
jgi:S1-C subfamily serine protease